jgi:hypothetical protein
LESERVRAEAVSGSAGEDFEPEITVDALQASSREAGAGVASDAAGVVADDVGDCLQTVLQQQLRIQEALLSLQEKVDLLLSSAARKP